MVSAVSREPEPSHPITRKARVLGTPVGEAACGGALEMKQIPEVSLEPQSPLQRI